MEKDETILRIEFRNSKPVELLDLTASFMALGDYFKDYANQTTGDPQRDNLKLYVKEIKSGSLIADMVALAEQAEWILEHKAVLAGFVANANDLVGYFLGKDESKTKFDPSIKQAKQIAQFVEPVAKDFGSQLNMTVMEGGVVNVYQSFNIGGLEANAVQNGVAKYLGPQLPSSQILTDQLMVLEQVKNDVSSKSGDRGIVETISPRPVKLQFAQEPAKRAVLDLETNPLQCIFQVNVEIRSVGGKPAMYRIIEVTDVISREDE
ncbi:hypothetical protein F9K88_10335 [Brucella intermedia]|uniref:Uncharacterized protein n=3 Tax=Brucella TaxID=234 RepID=M5JRK4_9HYPH|nr:hypothetical protein [Brucella intermedia]ELT50575.1 hypothetical protein D584_03188 [Brucella intermedia M86]KAB2696213.1 hypothetical protein F9K72_08955 [Brucella intermedia]KAB2711755.1 hypothetical protein F9K88_10335 [Brucella intermedia]NVM40469.1 hypothetical protein [Brucella intermedia]SUB12049.1 Uncharacterised protein [Brucella intermedia]